MKYQITTKTTGDEWEQVMTCEFANATIAELVTQDTPTYTYEGRRYIPKPNSDRGNSAARLQREGATVTLTCNKGHSWQRYWHSDPEVNKLELEALAKDWEAKEQAWLPIAQYFEARTKDVMNEWSKRLTTKFGDLEYCVQELNRKLSACQSLLESTRDQQDGVNTDVYDCLDIDTNQIKGLWKALYLHREKPFHFMDREK